MTRLCLCPKKPTAIIRDPVTKRPLPPQGAQVPMTAFWRRRLRAGEVAVVEQAPCAALPTSPVGEKE